MMRWDLVRPFVLLAALCCATVSQARAQSVERLMREIQARNFYLQGWRAGVHGIIPEDSGDYPVGAPAVDPIDWPDCDGCEPEDRPIFPNDGYYAVRMQDPEQAAEITRAVASGLHQIMGTFISPESVYPGTEGFVNLYTSGNVDFMGAQVSESDFTSTGSVVTGINESNYYLYLSEFAKVLDQLRYLEATALAKTYAETSEYGLAVWDVDIYSYFGVSTTGSCTGNIYDCVMHPSSICDITELLLKLNGQYTVCTFGDYDNWCDEDINTVEILLPLVHGVIEGSGPDYVEDHYAGVWEGTDFTGSRVCTPPYPVNTSASFSAAQQNIYPNQSPVPHEGNAELWIWVHEDFENRYTDTQTGATVLIHTPPVPGTWYARGEPAPPREYYPYGQLDPSTSSMTITVGEIPNSPEWGYTAENLKNWGDNTSPYGEHHEAGWSLSSKVFLIEPTWPMGEGNPGKCDPCCEPPESLDNFETNGEDGDPPSENCVAVPPIEPESAPEGAGCEETSSESSEEASIDDSGDDDSSDCPCDDSGSGAGPGSNGLSGVRSPLSQRPVLLAEGHKLEFATDLRVSLPGQDFYLRREYSSQIDLGGPNVVGNNWILPVTRMIEEVSSDEIILHGSVRGHLRFTKQSGTNTFWANGATTTYAKPMTDGDGDTIWRLTKPGVREVDFYDYDTQNVTDGLAGFIKAERDYYGRVWSYDYIDVGPIDNDSKRLGSITITADNETLAIIAFTWIGKHPDVDIAGKLRRVDVHRLIEGDLLVLTQWAEYIYAGQVPYVHPDVSDDDHGGTHPSPPDGNLVQVVTGTRMDEFELSSSGLAPQGSWYPFRQQFTQYRYHASSENAPPSGYTYEGPLTVRDVDEGRLKSVILPQQIEYFASLWNAGYVEPEIALRRAAFELMKRPDSWVATDTGSNALGFQTVDLCSKVIDYADTNRVVAQYTLSDCGCGGGSALGTMDTYEYFVPLSGTSGTTKITRYTQDSNGDYVNLHLTQYIEYDRFVSSTAVPYKIAEAIFAPSPDSRKWIERWVYEPNSNPSGFIVRRNTEYHSPEVYSGSSSYTPGSNSAVPNFTPGSTGLVYRYTFNSDHRLTEIGISNDPSGMTTVIPIKRITYPLSPGTNERTYLPTKVEWNRSDTHTNWGTQDDIETVTYSYGFKGSTDALAWVKRSVEVELVAENGPTSGPTSYDRYHIYDDYGQIAWTRAEDNSMVFRKLDPATGSILKLVQNAAITGPAGETEDAFSAPSGIGSTSGWGVPGSAGELATRYTHDLLGRTVSVTTPAGVTSFTRRGFLRNGTTGNNGVLQYAVTILPPGDTDERSGPISRAWYDARGNVVRRSQFLADISGANEYDPASADYTLGEEVTRSVSVYNVAGLRTSSKQWEDIGDDLFTSGGSGAVYETEFAYDALGRVSTVTDPSGTVTEYVYDALDRVTAQNIGMASMLETVAEYIYDSDVGTPSTAGVGNGLVTMVRAHEDGSNVRETEYTYDFRNRLIVTAPPEPPYEYVEYDNLDRITARAVFESAPTSISTPLADRGRYEESVYGQRGRMIRSKIAIDPTDSTPDFIESAMWLDEKGRVIKQLSPDSPVSKYEYDNLDRVATVSLTDGRNDALPGASGSYADAESITDDTVFQQSGYTYDADGHAVLQTVYSRLHDETGYGALDNTSSIITYAGTVYDRFDRPVASVNFGTNMPSTEILETSGASTVPTVPADLDELEGTAYDHTIYSTTAYDERGRVSIVTDPEGIDTAYFYDDLNRTIATVEAYDNASAPVWNNTDGIWSFSNLDDDKDRVTSFVYDGVGNVVKRVAHTSDTTEQVTKYVYGVTTTGSDIDSNRLLSKVHYPNESTGDADTSSDYTVTYTYNRLGEVKTVLDQNGTTHAYTRDDLGRVTIDSVTLGTNVDDFVKSLGYSFDDFGRVDTMTSYASTNASGTVRNQVQLEYTDLWQVERVLQSHAGVVEVNGSNQPINDTRAVAYAYTNEKLADGNHARPSTVTYPTISATSSTSDITYEYGASAGSADDLISRPTVLDFDDSGQGVEYTYLGLAAPAVIDYPVPDVQLDRTFSHDGKRNSSGYTQNAGKYPGWDPFMRVRLQAWMDGDLTENSPSAGYPNVPTILEERYVYSKASNRLGRLDAREGAKWAARDFGFSYDDLHRLIESQRGSASDPFAADPMATFTAGGVAGSGMSERWDLDVLGNWQSFDTNLDADTSAPIYDNNSSYSVDETEARTHNQANELTKRTLGSGITIEERIYTYDSNGNRLSNALASTNVGLHYIYDAWNRLVRVELRQTGGSPPPPVVISRSEYNAAWWRVFHEADTDLPSDGLDEEYIMVYGAGWQLLQEIIDSSDDDARDRTMEYFWGLRGIDDIAHRRLTIDRDEDTTWEMERYYHITDPLFSTVAVIDDTNGLIERVTYDAYGKARHHPRWDVDRDGDVDGDDTTAWGNSYNEPIGQVDYDPDADPDRDGYQIISDAFALASTTAGLASGSLSSLDYSDNRVGYAGYLRVEEAQLYCVRFRHYDDDAGRWVQRDPFEYHDGSMMYAYVHSDPVFSRDSYGLFSQECTECNKGDIQFVPGELATTQWISDISPDQIESLIEGVRRENKFKKNTWRARGYAKMIVYRNPIPGLTMIASTVYSLTYKISGANGAIWSGMDKIAHPNYRFSLWINVLKYKCECSSFFGTGINTKCDWKLKDSMWQKCANPQMANAPMPSLRHAFESWGGVNDEVINNCFMDGVAQMTAGSFDFEDFTIIDYSSEEDEKFDFETE